MICKVGPALLHVDTAPSSKMHSKTINNNPPPEKRLQTVGADNAKLARRATRVYLVEDSPQIQDSLLVFLHAPGDVEIVGFADNELEAVAAILADPVDTVVVDLNLREGSGMGVIEELRRANMMSQPMIIVFSNQFQPEIKMRALQLGADHFFDKSSEFENVKATIRTLRAQ